MKKIFLLLLFNITFVNLVQSQTFHAIIFANTKCPGDPRQANSVGIGPSVTCDYQRMKIEFETMATFLGYEKDFQYYEGSSSNFCREKLEYALNNLQCGKDDIVFFYYSGHGGRAAGEVTDSFPQMQLVVDPFRTQWQESQYYPISQVLKRIRAKNPRLTIVLGDLCNSVSNAVPQKDVPSMKGSTSISKAPCDFYRDLFLKVKGYIISSSSRPGETSAAFNIGGAYTVCFTECLQIMVSENMKPDWSILLEGCKLRTQSTTNGAQTPIYSMSLDFANSVNTTNPVETPTPQPSTTASSSLEDCLTAIGSSSTPIKERISLVNTTLSKYFSSSQAKVEIVGKDGQTVVGTKYADTYLNNLSIARNLYKIVTVDQSSDSSGKISYLKVHEMYK
ncbi:MAG: caspase family protein [Prevotella sp.]|nr:caspase family protein [Prevotella sp.]